MSLFNAKGKTPLFIAANYSVMKVYIFLRHSPNDAFDIYSEVLSCSISAGKWQWMNKGQAAVWNWMVSVLPCMKAVVCL